MFSFLKIIPMLISSMLYLITDEIFWVVVLLIAMQYMRVARSSHQLFDLPAGPVWPAVLYAVVFGLAGGFAGSFLLTFVGINVLEVGIVYLWITAVVLMLFQQRYLCFAYAGGLLSLCKLLFGIPAVSVPQIMGLVAILHMVESLLILFSGHLEPVPVYVRSGKGRIVGGFNLQKFWPLPLVALFATVLPNPEILRDAVHTPDWWPLIKPEYLQGQGDAVFLLMPVVAALGYGDIALTDLPKYKTRRAALELGFYSFILLLLAIASSYVPVMAVVAALFGPLGHEFLILTGQRREMEGEPYFVPPPEGIMALHILRNSPLKKAGVRDGDIIISINGIPVDNEEQLKNVLFDLEESVGWYGDAARFSGGNLKVGVLAGKKRERREVLVRKEPGEFLGLVPVPGRYQMAYLEMSGSSSLLKKWLQKLKKKWKR